jgi:hypothetical protein
MQRVNEMRDAKHGRHQCTITLLIEHGHARSSSVTSPTLRLCRTGQEAFALLLPPQVERWRDAASGVRA